MILPGQSSQTHKKEGYQRKLQELASKCIRPIQGKWRLFTNVFIKHEYDRTLIITEPGAFSPMIGIIFLHQNAKAAALTQALILDSVVVPQNWHEVCVVPLAMFF